LTASSVACATTEKLPGPWSVAICAIPAVRGYRLVLWVDIKPQAQGDGRPMISIGGTFKCLLAVFFVLTIFGCANSEKVRGDLRYGMAASPDGKQITFPPPPSSPRYAYAGELIGERNFFFDRPEKTLGQKFFELLTGVGNNSEREVELLRPQSVATDSMGRVFVSDMGQSAVVVFDPVEGEMRLLKRVDQNRVFLAPSGIAVGEQGRIFVADSEAGLVAQLDTFGRTFAPIGEGLLKRPTGLAYDKSLHRLYVSDTDENNIKVFDNVGRMVMTIGGPGTELGQFNRPTHLALWRSELYVTDTFNSRIQVFGTDDGLPIRAIGTRGTYVGQFAIPKGVAVDSDGNVYVVESLFDHLLVFNRSGQLLLPIGGTGYSSGSFYLPAGLWVDEGNRIYVADMYNGRVVTYLYLGGESESGD
jgi:DNA-binding beta-propeller fold protein YncE